jgi:hypothetical protein
MRIFEFLLFISLAFSTWASDDYHTTPEEIDKEVGKIKK